MWSIIGLIIVTIVGYQFYKKLGNSLPILEFMLLIAGLQWIIGAIIEYHTPFEHYKYYMYVTQSTYMGTVVPGYTLFSVILLWVSKKYPLKLLKQEDFTQFSPYALIFLIVGFCARFITNSIPGSLGFLVLIISSFQYIGAIILFFSKVKWHQYVLYGSIIILLFSSLSSGFFHDFILWSSFFYMFYAIKYQVSHKTKLMTIGLSFFALIVLQGVKSNYRAALELGYDGSPIALFVNTIAAQWNSGFFEISENQQGLNIRLNQGWIISAVLDQVPRGQTFANGQTVKEAIIASIFPRFLMPNKKMAGGQENFKKYTGLYLGANTSMGISVIGEFYANYGKGVTLAMGIWGLFLGFIWAFLWRTQFNNPFIVFFLPLIFLQVVKAETELVVVLNHLVKASIVVFAFFYVTRHLFKWEIYQRYEP